MISATNIYVQYGDRILLDHVNVVIMPSDKVGLVGRNGAGKSTFLKIIARHINPDKGDITRPAESTLGFLHQEMELPKGKSVMEETLTAFEDLKQMEQRLVFLEKEIGERTDYESDAYAKIIEELSDLSERFHMLGGGTMLADAEKILKGLGFKSSDMERLTDEFSGGWQMRIELAKMLLRRPDYLLLDEPTNHLDIESIIWLENWLKNYNGAVIVISHDKEFLDNVTRRTIEIELGNLYDYKAAYSKYIELRAERREKLQATFENQQKVIAQKERTINRFMAKATKTKMAQSMKKQLDKMDRVEIDAEDTAAMRINFPPAPRTGEIVIEAKKLSKQYGDLKVLEKIDLKLDRGDRVAFVGQNGQGKTTLAKMLVNQLAPTGGEIKLGHNVEIGYYAQNQAEALNPKQTLLEVMEDASPPEMRTRLRNILGAFLFSGEDAEKKVSVLSGGERARLALACLLLRPINLLVLDEPTNHLDMISKDVLKQAIQDYDGTLIVVSHDRDFLKSLTSRVIEFRDKKLFNYIGDVNAFLEKRKLDNMREVELQKNKPSEAKNNGEIDHKARKQLQRAVQQAERKIEKLEIKIEKIEVKMADPAFYQDPKSEEVIERYKKAKADLELAMEEWEAATLAMESQC